MNLKSFYRYVFISLVFLFAFVGCGNDANSGKFSLSDVEGNNTGVFIDSEVEGVKYVTSSGVEGFTNSKGEYKYNDGDEVEFFVNNLKLGSTTAEKLTTVFDLEYPTQIALLLQTIDRDGNPNNGIQISRDTAQQFQNANFTIDEVNPANKEFIKKYNTLTGRDITLDSSIAENHAISSLKKSIIDELSPKFFNTIRLNNFDVTVLDTNLNAKDYIHSLKAKLRFYLVREPTFKFLTSTSKILVLQSQGITYDAEEFQKEFENNLNTATETIAMASLLKSGYKDITELRSISKAFSATTGYVNDAKFWKQFVGFTKNAALTQTQSAALKTGFFSSSDDPEIEKKISDCYSVLIPDGLSQVQCFSRLGGEIIYNINNVWAGLQAVSLERQRISLELAKYYLKLYYALDADNHPFILAKAFSQIADNKLSTEEAKDYQFSSFNKDNDDDLEKALNLLSKVLGFSVKEPIFNADFDFLYNYEYAKQTISDQQNFINHTTELYMNSFDKSLLYDVDSEYLDINIEIEPSETQNYYKACVSVDNISSVNLKTIRGEVNLYLDDKLIKLDNSFIGDLTHTTNTFTQRCSEEFPLTFDEKILSMGIIKAEYTFKYFPSYYGNSDERDQTGSQYFEINKHSFVSDVAKPIIRLDVPTFASQKNKVVLDASKTTSFLPEDDFLYQWEYISSNSSVDVHLTWNNTSSGIAYITIPELPNDIVFWRHDFKLTVTSKANGAEAIKEFSIFVKNEKQEEETVEDNTETTNNQDDSSDTPSNNGTTTPIDTTTLTLQDCKDKTLNQSFSTNTWTTSQSEWNEVHIACIKIFSDNELEDSNIPGTGTNDDSETTDTPTNTSRTSIDYMGSHKTEKLVSTDCKVRNYQGWKDIKNELISTLAPADNMMKSIEGCIGVVQLIEFGGLSFDKAVESVVRSRTKETSPFSDVWDSSAQATPNLTVDDVSDAQNTVDNSSTSNSATLTLEKCKSKYGNYTNAQWASAQGSGEYKGEATACYQAIVAGPALGIDGQLYIDQYNNGVYGK